MSDKCCSNCYYLHEKAVDSEMMWHCSRWNEYIFDPDRPACTDWTECEKPAKLHNDNFCTWKYDYNYDSWNTSCGHEVIPNTEEKPSECDYVFCPYCGKKIKEVKEE